MSKPGSMTPGPWEAVDTGADVWEIVSPSRGVIAEASHHRVECKANARAIAALPELIEAARCYEAAHVFNAAAGHGHSTTEEMVAWTKLRRILARIEGGK